MHVKPVVVITGAVLCSAGALGVVLSASNPATAEPAMFWLFWVGLGTLAWALLVTLLLLFRQSLVRAVWAAAPWAVMVPGTLWLWHAGHGGTRLLGIMLSGTLVASLAVWWRVRSSGNHGPD